MNQSLGVNALSSTRGTVVADPVGATVEERAGAEINAFCCEPVIGGEDEDPLLWWKCNGAWRFPLMSREARKDPCACATSCASERVSSAAGVSPQRALIKPEKAI